MKNFETIWPRLVGVGGSRGAEAGAREPLIVHLTPFPSFSLSRRYGSWTGDAGKCLPPPAPTYTPIRISYLLLRRGVYGAFQVNLARFQSFYVAEKNLKKII